MLNIPFGIESFAIQAIGMPMHDWSYALEPAVSTGRPRDKGRKQKRKAQRLARRVTARKG